MQKINNNYTSFLSQNYEPYFLENRQVLEKKR